MMPVRVLLTSVVCLLLPATLQAASIVQNGGFEIGELNPWFQGNDLSPGMGEDWNATTTEFHSGQFSATNVRNKEIRQNFGALRPRRSRSFPFGSNIQPERLFCLPTSSTPTAPTLGISLLVSTTNWQFFNITNQLAPGKELTGFSVYGFEGSGTPRRRR